MKDKAAQTSPLYDANTDLSADRWREILVDAIESFSEAFGLFDADDRLILCNRRYAQTFTNHDNFKDIEGISFADLVRSSVAKGEIIEPEFQDDIEGWVVERTRRHRSPGGSLRQIQLGDGTWLQVSERPTANGGIVGVRTDITALKEAQQAAEAANESKTRFLRNMSHEIRTPINGVLGMAELLAGSRLDTTQRQYLDAIRQSGGHLLALINNILDLSKIEAGQIELEVIEISPVTLVEEAAAMLAPTAEAKSLDLIVDLEADPGLILRGDPLRLRQIIVNMLNNAIKFTERGQILLSLQADPAPEDVVALKITVSDTGVGIPAELHERIFDHFAQADGSTARKFGGTGLGLTICRQLARLMGGDISVQSAPGRGATFCLAVRLRRGAPQPAASLREDPMRGEMAGLKALVVDGNEASGRILQRRLRQWGLETFSADSVDQALRLMDREARSGQTIKLALLDGNLARSFGLDLARALRADRRYDSLRILLLSSASGRIDESQHPLLGISGSLTKPVRIKTLYDEIERVLAGEAAQSARTAPNMMAPKARHGHVLLAEDNEVNKVLALAMLRRLGLRVSHAKDGSDAVRMFREERVDLILMDCQMPEMDGFEASAEIRRLEAGTGRHTPIIALTANAIAGDRERCLAAGMDDYLSKPYSSAQLTEIFSRWLPIAASDPAPPVAVTAFDPANLETLRDLDPTQSDALLRRFIGLYFDAMKAIFAQMAAGFAVGDSDAVAAHAQDGKNRCFAIGVIALADLLREIENFARAGDIVGAHPYRLPAEREYERVLQALRQFLHRLAG